MVEKIDIGTELKGCGEMIEHIDTGTERYIINRFISMPKLFDELNIAYNLQSSMFCP